MTLSRVAPSHHLPRKEEASEFPDFEEIVTDQTEYRSSAMHIAIAKCRVG